MRKKLFLILTIFLIIIAIVSSYSCVHAGDQLDTVITKMSGVTDTDSTVNGSSGIGASANMIIGLLQIAGTGISIVTITILGAKYMLSSVEQKAEIKQRAMPVVIGMIILFGAVNIVAIVGNLANSTLNT
jgi:hypothetical protein